jgi:hypothetical protein
MAPQNSPKLRRVLDHLGAIRMLGDVFGFPELQEAAYDYDELVNGTIREVQSALYSNEDCTLPLNEVRKLFTVYWHLNYLRTDLAENDPAEAMVWQKKQKIYLNRWKTLLKSKHYPKKIMKTFKEYACVLKPQELEESLLEAKEPPYCGTKFTVCWHLAFLCNDLQELGEIGETDLWESEQSLYMPSEVNEKQFYREVAQSYATYLRSVMSRYDFVERGGEDSQSEYYIKCFRERHKSKQLEGKQRALEYVQRYEIGEPADIRKEKPHRR